MKNRYVPLKNYFIAFLIVFLIAFLSFYFYRWYKVYEEEQTRESYLLKTNTVSMQITNFDDIDTILSEAPNNYYIYISYTHSVDVLNLEKNLKKLIDKYGLNDIVYYIDITKIKNEDDYLEKLNSSLKINYLKSTPAMIYVKDGIITKENIIQSNKKVFNSNDFEKLLKSNGVEKLSL